MRWDNLFDDLESQLESELTAEDVDLQAEEERLRLGRMSIRDRLTALHAAKSGNANYVVRIMLTDGLAVTVHPAAIGKDWLSGDLIDDSTVRRQCIIPLAGLTGIILQPGQVDASLRQEHAVPTRDLSDRLGLAFVLRDLCRRRRELDLDIATGPLHGTIDRVGRDHLDVAVHDRGTPRRESAVQQHRIVPLNQLRLVRL